MGYTFISYSRKQLYFAEAITLHLQNNNIEAWFDLQKLQAGGDWRSILKEGYENCERLILIASSAALASPYVEVEWRTALENGREIILVVVENIEIPEVLQAFPVFDFRTRFNTRTLQLIDYITGADSPRKDNIPPPGKFPFSLHHPVAIWMALATQILPFLCAFLLSLLFLSIENIWFLVGSLLGGVLIFALFTRRFWKHELNYQTLRNIGWGVLILHVIVLYAAIFSVEENPIAGVIVLLVILSAFNNLIFQLVTLNFSANLLRWFAVGQITQRFRLRAHGKVIKQRKALLRDDTLPEPEPISYYLHHDPADQLIARRLSEVLDNAGHTPVFDFHQAKTQLVLVTNRTSRQFLEWTGETFSGRVIYLLGSPVNSIENVGSASNSQWVDIRENQKKIMGILARGLSDLDAWQREYALTASPKKFEAFHVPISIETYRYFGYLEIGSMFAAGFVSLLNGMLYEMFLGVVFGAALLLLMDRFSTRRLPGSYAFLGIMGTPIIYLVLHFNILIFLAGLVSSLPALITQILAFIIGYRWLPLRLKPAKDMLGMDADRKIRRWGYVMIFVFFVTNSLASYGLILLIQSISI